jgi:hypothetical protein
MRVWRYGLVAPIVVLALAACAKGTDPAPTATPTIAMPSLPSGVEPVETVTETAVASSAPSVPPPRIACSLEAMTASSGAEWPTKGYGRAASAAKPSCADGYAVVPYASPKTGDPIVELFRQEGDTWIHVDSYYGSCEMLVAVGVPKDVARRLLPRTSCTSG